MEQHVGPLAQHLLQSTGSTCRPCFSCSFDKMMRVLLLIFSYHPPSIMYAKRMNRQRVHLNRQRVHLIQELLGNMRRKAANNRG